MSIFSNKNNINNKTEHYSVIKKEIKQSKKLQTKIIIKKNKSNKLKNKTVACRQVKNLSNEKYNYCKIIQVNGKND